MVNKTYLKMSIYATSVLKMLYFMPFHTHSFFFFWESFNLWHLHLMIAFYHQTKTPISFWCRWGLNPKSLIQSSETLPVELTGTHFPYTLGNYYVSIRMFSLHPRWIQDFSSKAKKGQNKEVENKLIQKNFINISNMYLIN